MELKRLFDIVGYQLEKHPQNVALADKVKDKWVTHSTVELQKKVNEVSRALVSYGIKPGDKIGIITNNRSEFNFLDFGLLQIGAVDVPMYPTISENEYKFILNHAEVKMVFVSDKALYKKIIAVKDQVPTLKGVYTFDEVEGALNWRELLVLAKDTPQERIEELKKGIGENDLATIIYTSGTTGEPKGVMLSHKNIISNMISSSSVIPIKSSHRVISFLPISHIFERMGTYLFMYSGASIYYAEGLEKLVENIKEVRPHYFTTVPHLLEKVYQKILAKGNELTGAKRKLFFWALDLGLKYDHQNKGSIAYNTKLALANKLIFNKWREALGGEILGIITCAAALQPRLAKVFWAAQIPIIEGYGQTETSPVISANRFHKGGTFIGTVGTPVPGVDVKIFPDGEICIKGPNVMMGYYKRPDLTAEAIDEDGWLHTGDIGELVNGKFLKITDRKKELFKTSSGKYIAPQAIENKFMESFFIDQIMVIGENQKTISALIVPSLPSLESFAKENNIEFSSKEELLKNPVILKFYGDIRNELNKTLGDVEKVKKFALLSDEWSVDSGELTPTMKLKRKVIIERYKDLIQGFYRNEN